LENVLLFGCKLSDSTAFAFFDLIENLENYNSFFIDSQRYE